MVAILALLSVCAPAESAAKVPPGPIKHFIVLMMENRAFDHMLGWMSEKNPQVNGLNGTQSNPWDYSKPNGRRIFASKDAMDVRFTSKLHISILLTLCNPIRSHLTIRTSADLENLYFNVFQVAPDFSHSINGTAQQIYGTPTPGIFDYPAMQGFVQNARNHVRKGLEKKVACAVGPTRPHLP